MSARAYDSSFFDSTSAGSRRSANAVLPLVRALVPFETVVDIGCGVGEWLAAARELGAREIVGVDGEYVERHSLRIPVETFHAADLSRPLALGRRFDLALSLEVAEHLPEATASTFIASLTSLSDVVLFSAAVPGQGGTLHVNEQWPDYWAAHFASHGFVTLDCLRAQVWSDDRVEWWYAQNALLFVHEAALARYPRLLDARARSPQLPLAMVHPRLFAREHAWAERAREAPRLRTALGQVARSILHGARP